MDRPLRHTILAAAVTLAAASCGTDAQSSDGLIDSAPDLDTMIR